MALLVAASLRTLLPDPRAVIVAGVKMPETPVGSPLTVNAIAALNVEFRLVVSVTSFEFPPAVMLMEVAPAPSANVGVASTVTEIDTCCLVEPLVAETVAE